MNCTACEEAEKDPCTGLTNAGCESCFLRSIALGRDLFDAVQGGTEEYKRFLTTQFGEKAGEAHKRIVQWKKAFKQKKDEAK